MLGWGGVCLLPHLPPFLDNALYAACGKVIDHGALQLIYSVLMTFPVIRPFSSETLKISFQRAPIPIQSTVPVPDVIS